MKASDDWVQDTPDGVSIRVRVIPRAGATRVTGVREGRLIVRLAAAPVDGAANEALISLFAEILSVPSRNITMVSGARGRNKQIRVTGVDIARVRALANRSSERS
jgi:uncharacterized protein (TIGR00251 family)